MKINKFIVMTTICTMILTMATTFATEEEPPKPPELNGTFAMAMDLDTQEIIYAKAIDQKAFPASTTKIMTALIFAEHASKADLVQYTDKALAQPSYALHRDYGPISLGYQMTGDMVMKSLLIYSANDVAAMVEDHLKTQDIDLMTTINARMTSLGLENSHYTSPNGIHDDNHYTTAYDLGIMAVEAFSNPWIQEVLSMEEVVIEIESGLLPVTNSNQKLNNDGLIYAKTGYTEEAGRCLVAVYQRDGRRIVGAVMHADYNYEDLIVFKDMDTLMDWSFEEARQVSYMNQANFDLTTEVTYKPLKTFGKTATQTMELTYKDDLVYYPNAANDGEIQASFDLFDIDPDALSLDVPVGKITLVQRNLSQTIDVFPTLSTDDLYDQHKDLYRLIKIASAVGIGLLGLLVIGIGFKIKKRMGKQRKYF